VPDKVLINRQSEFAPQASRLGPVRLAEVNVALLSYSGDLGRPEGTDNYPTRNGSALMVSKALKFRQW